MPAFDFVEWSGIHARLAVLAPGGRRRGRGCAVPVRRFLSVRMPAPAVVL